MCKIGVIFFLKSCELKVVCIWVCLIGVFFFKKYVGNIVVDIR